MCRIACLPQVLSDWKGQDRDEHRRLTAESKGKWGAKISAFFTRARDKKTPKTNLKTAKLANKFSLMATDHILQGAIDDNLRNYRVDSTVRFPLKDFEQRFMVPLADLPPELRTDDVAQGRVQRSCILDTRTGETTLELMSTSHKKSLHVHADKGPCSRSSLVWLFTAGKARGLYHWDPLHMKHNLHLSVLRSLKLAGARHEMCLVSSCGLGPWSGCGHHGKYSEALQ